MAGALKELNAARCTLARAEWGAAFMANRSLRLCSAAMRPNR